MGQCLVVKSHGACTEVNSHHHGFVIIIQISSVPSV